jgi:hypothetical protein
MSRTQLGRLVGYEGPTMICMIERGITHFPLKKWEVYAEALRVPKHEFLRIVFQEAYPAAVKYIDFHECS